MISTNAEFKGFEVDPGSGLGHHLYDLSDYPGSPYDRTAGHEQEFTGNKLLGILATPLLQEPVRVRKWSELKQAADEAGFSCESQPTPEGERLIVDSIYGVLVFDAKGLMVQRMMMNGTHRETITFRHESVADQPGLYIPIKVSKFTEYNYASSSSGSEGQ